MGSTTVWRANNWRGVEESLARSHDFAWFDRICDSTDKRVSLVR
ncbi:MAG TPA: hypothetical protein VF934_00575 [Burkholderiales bacterium]